MVVGLATPLPCIKCGGPKKIIDVAASPEKRYAKGNAQGGTRTVEKVSIDNRLKIPKEASKGGHGRA